MLADPFEFFLDCQSLQRGERQGKKETNPPVKNGKRVAKGSFNLRRRSFYRCRVGDSPMSGDRLSGPIGAYFVRGIVADREHKIDDGRTGGGKLVPGLAAQSGSGDSGKLKQLQRLGPNRSGGIAACAVCGH